MNEKDGLTNGGRPHTSYAAAIERVLAARPNGTEHLCVHHGCMRLRAFIESRVIEASGIWRTLRAIWAAMIAKTSQPLGQNQWISLV